LRATVSPAASHRPRRLWSVSVLIDPLVEDVPGAGDLGQDGLGRGGPHVGLGIGIAGVDVGLDAGDPVGDAREDPAARVLVGEVAEPMFDLIQPG
jgi:hypothetical protein